MRATMAAVLLMALLSGADATGSKAMAKTTFSANPMRRVVTMLQMMQKKVEAEGEKESELFEKFMCYCKSSSASLGKSIGDAEDKVPQLESSIEETEGVVKQLNSELMQHKADREEATAAIAKATAIREKEAKSFAAENAEQTANIAAAGKAIPAIEKGMGGAFLQTGGAQQLKHALSTMSEDALSASDHDLLQAFLEGSQSENENDQGAGSGEILGILKQMKETMEKDLADMVETEKAAKADFDALVASKEKEIAAATKAIEEKTARLGEVMVELVNTKEDHEDTAASLAEDKKLLQDLEKTCEMKTKEYETSQKTRSEEMVALADVIKMLNDDDAQDLFKKTLPSASAFVQLGSSSAMEVRHQALAALRGVLKHHHGSKDYRLNYLALAMKGKKVGFDKVIKMVDDMVVLLGKEQGDDDKKKAYCEAEIDKTEDEIKVLKGTIGDLEAAIAEQKESMDTINEELSVITKGLADLDQEVALATAQRKAENEEFTVMIGQNNAAMQLIEMAKNRLNKFYNPKLYKAPPKRELTEEERISLNMGGTLAPTNPPGGIAGTGVSAIQEYDDSDGLSFAQVSARVRRSDDSMDEPPALPQTFASYAKQSEESGGVIAMMDMLKADLTKEIQEGEFTEKDLQSEYETMVKAAAEKRLTDLKSVEEKEAARAEVQDELLKLGKEKKSREAEQMDTQKALIDLHEDCDWLMKEYENRKAARANEIDALKKAKAVLSGADYSLVQTGVHHRHLRRAHA